MRRRAFALTVPIDLIADPETFTVDTFAESLFSFAYERCVVMNGNLLRNSYKTFAPTATADDHSQDERFTNAEFMTQEERL